MVLVLTVVVLQSISFANYALTTKTTNIIYGSAPYLTFDGGRTRVTNTEALLGISLSDGRRFTPTTNNSERNPIVLPVVGQSFNDIGMLVPRDTDSIALSSLIGTPYNYWGDDDGDGQGVNGITATGRLNVSIVDKNNRAVARNEVLTICKAPYKLTLSNGEGTLTTRYGVPNESRFTAGNATYYINPKAAPAICFARPDLAFGTANTAPADIWDPRKGFLTQSATPSSYDLNFPTTGANNLYFDLDISGVSQALSWAPVSHGGITATMTNSTSTSVRVTLTGPAVTNRNQWASENPGRIDSLSLPQTFELVGRDSSGNAVVKYGFVLKQWFVHRGPEVWGYRESWCNGLGGYRIPNVKELTNGSCKDHYGREGVCTEFGADRPSPNDTPASRQIGGGLFSEWGGMKNYNRAGFTDIYSISGYFAQEFVVEGGRRFNHTVSASDGKIYRSEHGWAHQGICTYP
ncbi:hypothetical protein [Gilliamella apis]|uniref:hypothetical protein n=1 Tax=Gilliamella apis TaxID=1970738 RepID=UPI000A33A90B|nr:hypothetical protein [Gilliamella apis]OTQ34515.1 hypothetical protein B6C88_11325 [Gilliamella apis]OTQ35446.1 hypothetical protein B6C84_06445 [Gilliamella apis]OTQ40171.1 hypothetical protein B6D26_06905 [Gilliamella apis]OTQ43224.1 hypothetical protein B6C94_04265 [Gilliamella apis]OTQ44228.1 hypothetical protein B6C86_11125 [Gilliamella apis]